MFNTNIKSIVDLLKTFPTQEDCTKYLEQIRWNNEPVSPFDESSKVYKCKHGKYKCKNSRKYFNVCTGTMFENTKIELQKWFLAIWLITCHKKGISSMQLSRDLDITQKSAWFMLQRIRACFSVENEGTLEGTISVDESFVGGKNKNRHKDKKVPMSQGRSFKDKTPVLGLLQRNGKLRAIVIGDTKAKTLQPIIKRIVKPDSVLITDEWLGYRGIESFYSHYVVDHSKKQYVDYDNPEIHTNDIEGFWGIMKRGYNGIYNWWSKKHMQKYVDEFVFRYNMRQKTSSEKFNQVLLNSNFKTTYENLCIGRT